MTIDPTSSLPDGSHAWCIDCPWKAQHSHCDADAKQHAADNEHIVHVYIPDCHSPKPDDPAVLCELQKDHHGDVHMRDKVEWPVLDEED